jgi:hypothetical protein
MGFLSDAVGAVSGLSNQLLGTGTQTSTGSQRVNMPSWLQDPAQGLLSDAQKLSQQAYTPYGGQTVAGFDPYQTQGINQQAQLAQQGSQAYGMADQQLQRTLSGGGFQPAASNPYAGSNPYLSQQIDQAQGDVIRNYNNVAKPQTEASMVRSGSFGNSGLLQMQQQQQSDLQRNLGDISSGMRFNDYQMQAGLGENQANRNQGAFEAERQRQYGAIGATPGFTSARYLDSQMLQGAGQQRQGQQQAELMDAYQRFQQQQAHPYQQQQYLQSILNPMMGIYRGVDTTQNNPGKPLLSAISELGGSGGLSGGMSGLGSLGASIFSDRRLKEDIKKVGKTEGGSNIYTYRYKGDDRTHMGVMAQEMREKDPSAVHEVGGLLAVDYSKVK